MSDSSDSAERRLRNFNVASLDADVALRVRGRGSARGSGRGKASVKGLRANASD